MSQIISRTKEEEKAEKNPERLSFMMACKRLLDHMVIIIVYCNGVGEMHGM